MTDSVQFNVGDLVVFRSISPNVMKNQVGIIVQSGVKQSISEKVLIKKMVRSAVRNNQVDS